MMDTEQEKWSVRYFDLEVQEEVIKPFDTLEEAENFAKEVSVKTGEPAYIEVTRGNESGAYADVIGGEITIVEIIDSGERGLNYSSTFPPQ